VNAYQEKLRSLGFRARIPAAKVTEIDARDTGNEGATITEHWDDGQSVVVRPPTVTGLMGSGDS
jgi:hypothetical protein